MNAQIEVERSGQTLTIRWTRRGRLMSALYRGAKLFPLIMGGLAIFFMPDYVCRFAEEEPVTGLFWGSLAGLALLISFLASTLRYFRSDRWIFDGANRTVTAEVKTLWGQPGVGEADLRDLEALRVRARRWPRTSEMRLRLDSGEEEVIVAGHGMGEQISEAAEEIRDFLRDQRYQVALESIDEHESED